MGHKGSADEYRIGVIIKIEEVVFEVEQSFERIFGVGANC